MRLSRTPCLFCKLVFLKLNWTDITQPRMQSCCIVKRQPIHNRRLGFFASHKTLTINTGSLQRFPQALSRCIAPAITFATHRTSRAIRLQGQLIVISLLAYGQSKYAYLVMRLNADRSSKLECS